MHDPLVLHSHHTQRDPSVHGHADSGSVASGAQPTTTRTMRAGSCSSNATESTVATAGSSNYDTDGSSSTASEASRKRKCDVLDHHHHHHRQHHHQQQNQQHAASQPRTPGPMLASTSPVLESRSRSSTTSSSAMQFEPGSGSTTTPNEQIRFSCSTTAMTLSRANSGTQPTHSLPSRRQNRQPLSLAAERDSTDRPSCSSSSLSVSMPPSPTPVAETSKRPRLAAVASTGHFPSSSAITHDGTSARVGSGGETAYLHPLPATLDISSDNDLPNGPPSASFSNLTITQPPSPAYAAFSVNIPTPPRLLPNTSGDFPQHHRDDTLGPSATTSQDSLFTRSLPPRRSSFRSTGPTDLPRAATVRRIDRHPVRHTPARRRLRRAMSLPLEDEVTLSRRQLQRSRAQHHQEEAPLAFLPSTDFGSCGQLQGESSEMPGADLHEDEGKAAIKSVQPQERRLSSSEESAVSILPNDAVDCMQIEQARAVSGSFQHTSAPSSHVNSATPAQVKVPMSLSSSSTSASPPVLMSPTQLAALHRFNMPKPVMQSQNRSTFPVFPPRSQLASQARLSNPSSESTIQPSPAALPAGSRNASSSSLHRPNGSSDAKRAPPTASIPASNPPIARETLRELDLQEILQCRQLRHDIVFDANLMFRPNFDGDRGDRKREAADRYWTAVTRELQSGCRCTAYSFAPSATARSMGKQSTPLPCICRHAPCSGDRAPLSCRLPSRIVPLIAELRDILLALLPLANGDPSSPDVSSGRRSSKGGSTMSMATAKMIQQTLDPELIAQEVAHGVLDVASLANFFGGTLKSHCAPMRDEVIENMITSIRKGGQANNMSLVSHGLRMCFEILELMKLDIANHQLRMLRPYLLETAADFECKSFMQLQGTVSAESANGMNVDGPPLDRTKAWLTIARLHLATTAGSGQVDGRALVCEGVLELVFNPSMNTNQPQATASNIPGHRRQASSISEVGTSQSRSRRPKCLSLPLSGQIPETLQLDISRLQLFHGDIVDLCVVHLLLLLFRQLCSSHKRIPATEELDTIRRQIWVIMSEINTAAHPARGLSGSSRRPLSPIPQSVKKLDSTRWRGGMKDVLLQIARYATGSQSGDAATSYVPDTSTLSMLDSWMENNLKTESTLFRIVQKRLRAGLSGLINYELVHVNRPASKGWDLASVDASPEVVNMLNTIIKQNSLTDLAGEVRLLATRIAKAVGYNARAYQELYSTL